MTRPDHRIVEDYRKIFDSLFSAPLLKYLPGKWYYFEKEGEPPLISIVHEEVMEGFSQDTGFDYLTRELGYTATPLLIYKVDVKKFL